MDKKRLQKLAGIITEQTEFIVEDRRGHQFIVQVPRLVS